MEQNILLLLRMIANDSSKSNNKGQDHQILRLALADMLTFNLACILAVYLSDMTSLLKRER